jgi:tRNA-dihydrouridine synthase
MPPLLMTDCAATCSHLCAIGEYQVDVNMGCPKRSAVTGGSGSALFADAQRAEEVVRALRGALPPCIALSCKVRLHGDGAQETLRRCTRLVAAGASSIAIHARHPDERSCDLARWAELPQLARSLQACGATVLVNGDALDAPSAASLARMAPGCSVMVGRGALHAANGLFTTRGLGSDGTPLLSERDHIHARVPSDDPPMACRGHSEDETCGDGGREAGCDVGTGDAPLDAATMAMCVRYAQIAFDVENNPLNTAFVLQWILHARLRERLASEQCTSQPLHPSGGPLLPPAPRNDGEAAPDLQATAAALRGASSHSAIASALSLGTYLQSRQRGQPAAPTHRYTPGYFDSLDGMSDWAQAPSRAALYEAHAASSTPLATNQDFRRLVLARAALAAPAHHRDGAPSSSAAPKEPAVGRAAEASGASQPADEPEPLAGMQPAAADVRAKLVAAVGPAFPVRYFVLEEAEPSAKALGYFAKAWRCRVVVGGRSYDGAFRKSRCRAEQDAAQVAIDGLAACPLHGGDRKRAKRDAKRRGDKRARLGPG